jgi:predicted dehydrogenase
MQKLRIGFLSTAGIGKKNWKAIFNSGNCLVSAVASRDLNKSRKYIDDCQHDFAFAETPRAFGSYEELIASPDADAVYVPMPTALRKEWVLRAAAAGKHVLCEKPCGTSAAELDEMLAACAKNKVQFMDGVMFMHSPRLAKIREILDDAKSIGEIRHIASAFSFYSGEHFFHDNIRVNAALEPAGCVGDLGWYCLRFALWAMNWQLPREVTAKNLSAPGATASTEFTAELIYDGAVSVTFYCSFLAAHQQWVHVSGQNGWLRVPGFVHPLNSYEPAFEVNDAEVRVVSDVKCPPGVDPKIQGHAMAQDTRMWRNFANQIHSGKLNADWPMWAAKTQKVLDACLEAARRGTSLKLGT